MCWFDCMPLCCVKPPRNIEVVEMRINHACLSQWPCPLSSLILTAISMKFAWACYYLFLNLLRHCLDLPGLEFTVGITTDANYRWENRKFGYKWIGARSLVVLLMGRGEEVLSVLVSGMGCHNYAWMKNQMYGSRVQAKLSKRILTKIYPGEELGARCHYPLSAGWKTSSMFQCASRGRNLKWVCPHGLLVLLLSCQT